MVIGNGSIAARVSRRQVVAGAVLATSVGALPPCAAATGSPAWADDGRLRCFDARYVTADDRSIVGHFVLPRSNQRLDVVVMLPASGEITDEVRAAARRQALGGALVVVPDLDATVQSDARTTDRGVLLRTIAAHVEPLRRHPRGNGRLMIVSV